MSVPGVSAIVLAGGRSSRFGRDKLAEIVEPASGRTLLDQTVATVASIASETIVVARPDDSPRVVVGIIVVHDQVADEGPLVGLLTGLRQASQPTAIMVGGDMPTMVPAVLEALIAQLDDPAQDAAILEDDARPRPLPAALRTAPAIAAAERLVAGGERRLGALIEALTTVAIPESSWRRLDPHGRTLHDVDTPADLPLTSGRP